MKSNLEDLMYEFLDRLISKNEGRYYVAKIVVIKQKIL